MNQVRWVQAWDDSPDIGDFVDGHDYVIRGEMGHVGCDEETRTRVLTGLNAIGLLREVLECVASSYHPEDEGEGGRARWNEYRAAAGLPPV